MARVYRREIAKGLKLYINNRRGQGVRPKGYVIDVINAEIGDDIAVIREEIKRFQSKRATESRRSLPSQSEAKANESDAFQPEPFELELADDQKTQIEANLKGLQPPGPLSPPPRQAQHALEKPKLALTGSPKKMAVGSIVVSDRT